MKWALISDLRRSSAERSALIEIAVILHTPGTRITPPKAGAGLDPGTQLDPIRLSRNPSSLDKYHITSCRGGRHARNKSSNAAFQAEQLINGKTCCSRKTQR